MKILILLSILISITASAADITILFTNDHHGRYWQNKKGEAGMPARLTLIQEIRNEVRRAGGETLLLSGGDINTGPAESNLFKAEPDFIGMAALEYDAMAIGNHEFDHSLETLFWQQSLVQFPFLSANIFYRSNNRRIFKPYIIKEIQGVKIALLGLTTRETVQNTPKVIMDQIYFTSPIEAAQELVPKLKEKVDIIIALTHMGHKTLKNKNSTFIGDIELAKKVKGIDLIFGGHSEVALEKPLEVGETKIFQAHHWGRFLGRVDLNYNKKNELKLIDHKLIPINLKKKVLTKDGKKSYVYIGKEISQDQNLLKRLKKFKDEADVQLGYPIGIVTKTITGERALVRSQPTHMAELFTRSIKTKLPMADFVLMTGGNLRADLEQGQVNMADIMTLHPWDTSLAQVELTGKEVKELVQYAVSIKPGSGSFPYFQGLKVKLSGKKINTIYINQNPIRDEQIYRLASIDFLLTGGDGYPDYSTRNSYSNASILLYNAIADLIIKNSPIDKKEFKPTDFKL